jgi:hypothetical protein
MGSDQNSKFLVLYSIFPRCGSSPESSGPKVREVEQRTENPPLINGAVAQLVEQRTENPCVGGSIPPHTTAEKAPVCRGFSFFRFPVLGLLAIFFSLSFKGYADESLVFIMLYPGSFNDVK